MLLRKPLIWNVQPGLVARAWREHWRGAKAVFPFWEAGGGSIYPVPGCTRWGLNNGAVRKGVDQPIDQATYFQNFSNDKQLID